MGHSPSFIFSPTPRLVAGWWKCTPGSTVASLKSCPSVVQRHIKRRLGRTLRGLYCKRHVVRHRKSSPYQFPGTKGSVSGSQEFRATLRGSDCVGSNGQHNCGFLYQQRGRFEIRLSLCPPLETSVLVPSQANSPEGQAHSRVCPQLDLFATQFNHKLPRFVSLFPDQKAWVIDALSLPWTDLDVYAFPPISLLNQVVAKVMDQGCHRMILIAPGWPSMPWFWDLVNLSVQIPLSLNSEVRSGDTSVQRASSPRPQESESACLAPRASIIQEQGFSELRIKARIEAPQRLSARAVYKSKWAIFVKWCSGLQVTLCKTDCRFSVAPVSR